MTRDRGCHHLRYGQLPVGWVRVEAAASQQAAPTAVAAATAAPGQSQSTPSGAEPVGTSALLFEIWNSRTLAQDTLIGTALFKVGGCGSAAVGVSFLGAECSHKNHACTGPARARSHRLLRWGRWGAQAATCLLVVPGGWLTRVCYAWQVPRAQQALPEAGTAVSFPVNTGGWLECLIEYQDPY